MTGERTKRTRAAGARRDGGAAAVEFALLLPLIVALLFGMIDLGVLLNTKITVTEAARQAIRTYVLTRDDDPDTRETTKRESGLAVLTALAGPPTTIDWTTCTELSSTSTLRTATVKVTYERSAVIGLIPGLRRATLSSTAVMPCPD
ncbi:TadE/TadG family type IV pilus assembly protein [Actinocorallia longicatena]|uniref:TadE-like domain-containing protein n=1 Tax=Actinocorallia longicatena TaxID=111803 RepID=A0ABP6QJ77_9ACTN